MEFCVFVEPKEKDLGSLECYVCKYKEKKKHKDESCIASDEPSKLFGGTLVEYDPKKAEKCPLYIEDEEEAKVLLTFLAK